jgi:hypothetical protein
LLRLPDYSSHACLLYLKRLADPIQSGFRLPGCQSEAADKRGPLFADESPKSTLVAPEPPRTISPRLEQAATLNARSPATEVLPRDRSRESSAPVERASVHEIKAGWEPPLAERVQGTSVEKDASQRVIPPLLEPSSPSVKEKSPPGPRAVSVALRPLPVEAARTPERAPVVQIHIGRIEVRAVTPSSVAPARPVSHAPKLTLEDYLHQRNKGQR